MARLTCILFATLVVLAVVAAAKESVSQGVSGFLILWQSSHNLVVEHGRYGFVKVDARIVCSSLHPLSLDQESSKACVTTTSVNDRFDIDIVFGAA